MPRFARLACLCAALAVLAACSTVRVVEQGPESHAPLGELPAPVRSDRANTNDFPPGEDGYRPPARLAVLLPMSGNLASAGQSVRDGFLAAYYAEARTRPALKFYDSQGTGAGAQSALAKALADGAQMVVGPLTREEVNGALGQAGAVPTIALNRGSRAPPSGSASFALLPEDEGAQAADRLADRGLLKVLVVAARGDSAQRAVAAFRAQLRERGGDTVGEVPIAGEIPDLTAQLGGFAVGAAPAQAVFLVLDAAQARTVAAQLKASAIAALPRIATSQLLNGIGSRGDVELDGIEYPELPWLLGRYVGLPEAGSLAKSLPAARGGGQRLFAFGADAWKLAAYFERLYNDPAYSLQGATGELHISIAGPVERMPAWAVFSGGRGRPAPDVAPARRDGAATR
jgi:outer membrane PBP1 activator LpoA protein